MGVPFIAWGWVRLFGETAPVFTSRNRPGNLAVAAITLVALVSVWLAVPYQFSLGDALTAAVVSTWSLSGSRSRCVAKTPADGGRSPESAIRPQTRPDLPRPVR